MPITTGDFFRCILLAAANTAMGRALDDIANPAAATTTDWINAIKADTTAAAGAPPVIVEDASVVAEFINLLSTQPYQPIFAALLEPVTNSKGTKLPLIAQLKNQVNQLGTTQNLLNVPWGSPPHPGGRFVWRLIDTLTPYDEQ